MKILFFVNTKLNLNNNSTSGGIETLNIELSNYLKKKNIYVILANKISSKIKKIHWDIVISSNDARIFDKVISKKKILWLHNKLQIEKSFRKRQFFPILMNEIHTVFVSKYLKDITAKIYNFKTSNIIPNFLIKNFQKIKINFNRRPIFIWSVQRSKGLKETMDMWIKEIHINNVNAEFHIFGLTRLKNHKRYKKHNIFFHGRVDKKILVKFYKKSMAMICLGYDETFCLNAIESMSCGLPVLSFKKTALNNLIINGINGYKVDDFKSLSRKINLIIDYNKIRRNKIINNTYKYSIRFYFMNIKKKWIRLISK